MAKVLTVENLAMKSDEQTISENLNFALKRGSMTALLGLSGAGKTTLIRVLMDILAVAAGVFKFSQNTKIGYVPQFRNIGLDYPLSIRAFIELSTPLFKSASVKKRVDNILKEINLLEIQNTWTGEVSGGQRQRAYLVQALLDEPNFIILDGATASLDPVAEEESMALVKHLDERHDLTVLFTTYGIPLAKKYMKDYLLFEDKNLEHNKISQLAKKAYG